MSDIVQRHTALPANFGENLMQGIADTRSTMLTGDGGKPLLRLLRTGTWVFGPNNEKVNAGSEWAVNLSSLGRGWVCWDDGELMGQVMASVQAKRLPQPEAVNGVPFVEQFSMELTCVSGADDGTLVLYKNNSLGFKKAFEQLIGEVQARWALDKAFYWPVVELTQESYEHKKYGEIFNPLLPVVAWTNEAGEFSPDSDNGPEPEPEPEPEPVPVRTRGRPKAAVQVPDEDPKPTAQTHTGQRRRPASR